MSANISRNIAKEIRTILYKDGDNIRIAFGDIAIDAVIKNFEEEDIIFDDNITSIHGLPEAVQFSLLESRRSGFKDGKNYSEVNPED